ncbi:hypothetical protein EVC30_009 [Rhizobium phage RHph_Y1_11]|nr:hypothetical protein EVC30_009 [Rhizobium phage RHph_Y1_11]
MANRLLLDTTGLKISKPGIDVLTAAAGNLQFSSDWKQLRVYGRGSFTVPNPIGYTPKALGGWNSVTFTVSLGKTFSGIPVGNVMVAVPGWAIKSPANSFNLYLTHARKDPGTLSSIQETEMSVTLGPSALTVTCGMGVAGQFQGGTVWNFWSGTVIYYAFWDFAT